RNLRVAAAKRQVKNKLDGSPPPKSGSSPTISPDDSQADCRIESQISKSSMADANTTRQVRSLLERNRIYIDDPKGEESGAALIKKARGIMEGKRGSDWSNNQAESVKDSIKSYRNEPEATFAMHFMSLLLGGIRKIPKEEPTEDEIARSAVWIEEAFEKAGLRTRVQINFASNSVPRISAHDPSWDKILALVPRVTNPRPDIAFSLYKTAFEDQRKRDIFDTLKCSLTGLDAYHTWCIIEFKCIDASIAEAENQCASGGAAMVQNRRRYNSAIVTNTPQEADPQSHQTPQSKQQQAQQTLSQPFMQHHSTSSTWTASTASSPIPDMASIAFSMAVAPDQAKIFVNWVHVGPDSVHHWHMHRLQTYSLDNASDISVFHHDLNNILDWGVGRRKREIEQQAQKSIDLGLVPLLGDEARPTKRKRGDEKSKQ
ncbi:MAG: hypothetical protein Q9217_006920, partial [Psora testacea]